MTSTVGLGLAVSTVIFALRPDAAGGPSVWLPLVRRTRAPFLSSWALPGGMVRVDESLEGAARRNLGETTRLEPAYLEQLYAFGDVDRSPDQRMVSIVYWALVRPDEAERVTLGENVRWFAADELPDLAFDHNLIVEADDPQFDALVDLTATFIRAHALNDATARARLSRIELAGATVERR